MTKYIITLLIIIIISTVCTACDNIDPETKVLNEKYRLSEDMDEVAILRRNDETSSTWLTIKNFIAYCVSGDLVYLCEESVEKTMTEKISEDEKHLEVDYETQRYWIFNMSDESFIEMDMSNGENKAIVEGLDWELLWGGRTIQEENAGEEIYELKKLLHLDYIYKILYIPDGEICVGGYEDTSWLKVSYLLNVGSEDDCEFYLQAETEENVQEIQSIKVDVLYTDKSGDTVCYCITKDTDIRTVDTEYGQIDIEVITLDNGEKIGFGIIVVSP